MHRRRPAEESIVNPNETGSDHDQEATERSLARLLKLSGERENPSPEATARAHAAAHDAWQGSLREARVARQRNVITRLAAVFSIALIGALAWKVFNTPPDSPLVVAHITGVSAPTTLTNASGERLDATAGIPIRMKSRLQTETGRASLKIGDALSLRLDTNSELLFEDDSSIRLLAGAIYIDSGGLNAATNLRVLTPAGEVQHEGTQYQIRLNGEITQIKVREGRVRLLAARNGGAISIVAGEQIQIDDEISKSSVPSFGRDWDWASTMAAPIDIDNRPLIEFLTWIAREHGWQLRYAGADEERAVQSIRLHGSAKGATPLDTLRRVSLVTGLSMHVENGVLLVGPGRKQSR